MPMKPKRDRITIRVYRPESGFVTIDMPDGHAPDVGSHVEIGGVPWKVTMIEFPISSKLKPGIFSGPDGLTGHGDGTNVVGVQEDDREDSP